MIDSGKATIDLGNGKVFTISADFGHAFYSECFNETIVMNNIKVDTGPGKATKIESKVNVIGAGGLYTNAFNTTSQAERDRNTYYVGVKVGKQEKQQENYDSGTVPLEGNPGEIPV